MIWNTVKRVAGRAGVVAHVHALRGACAVQLDEASPGEIIGIKEYLGHSRIETTLVYLRRKDRAHAMKSVARGLSIGSSGFPSKAQEAHTGFEPVSPQSALPEPLRRKLEELKAHNPQRSRREPS